MIYLIRFKEDDFFVYYINVSGVTKDIARTHSTGGGLFNLYIMAFLNKDKVTISLKAYNDLVKRLNDLEEKQSNCECNNKYKKRDFVNFIYANELHKGKILGKEDCGDCYIIQSGSFTYAVPEKQIAYGTNNA